jgi:hypothetical protein
MLEVAGLEEVAIGTPWEETMETTLCRRSAYPAVKRMRRGIGMPGLLRRAAAVVCLLATAGQVEAQTRDTAATRLRGGESWKTDFSRRAVPSREIVSGGPPKDGIPPLATSPSALLRRAALNPTTSLGNYEVEPRL